MSYTSERELWIILQAYLGSAEVRDRTDPLQRRFDRLTRACVEAKRLDLALSVFLVASTARYGVDDSIVSDCLMDCGHVRRVLELMAAERVPPEPPGPGAGQGGGSVDG